MPQTGASEEAVSVRHIEIPVTAAIDAALAAVQSKRMSVSTGSTESTAAVVGGSRSRFHLEERCARAIKGTMSSPTVATGGYVSSTIQTELPRCVDVIMSQWHAMVLVVWGCDNGAVVVFSHITGAVVQVCNSASTEHFRMNVSNNTVCTAR